MSQRFDQSLQASSLVEIPASGESQPLRGEYATRHLPAQPQILETGIYRTVIEEGPRYTFACVRHQFASLTVIDREDLPSECPHCVLELEERHGRLRYAALQMRLSASL